MEFPDNSFDLVWACESGEHMPDKKAYVDEMVRRLPPTNARLYGLLRQLCGRQVWGTGIILQCRAALPSCPFPLTPGPPGACPQARRYAGHCHVVPAGGDARDALQVRPAIYLAALCMLCVGRHRRLNQPTLPAPALGMAWHAARVPDVLVTHPPPPYSPLHRET